MIMLPLLFLAITAPDAGCTSVAGERILGADLARALPVFAPVPADLAVSYTPQPGLRRVIPVEQLTKIAHDYGIPEQPFQPVCFVSPLSTLVDADVLEAMRGAFPGAEVRIEIEDVAPRIAPPGKLMFPIAGLQPPRQGETTALWRGFVLYSVNKRYPLAVRARVTQKSSRVVAVGSLTVRQAIASDRVRVETVEGFPGTGGRAKTIEDVIGKIPRRTIAAGTAVMATDVMPPPDILKGERVQVEVRNGTARLMLDAMAQAPGRAGDMIAVKNLQSGRNFFARVEGRGRVAVILKGNTP